MSYFEDLTPYNYYHLGVKDNTLNIGWLDNEHSYQHGRVDDNVLRIIWEYLHFRVLRLRGFHTCELCVPRINAPISVKKDDETIQLGSSEIRVIGNNGKMYASPDLIYHYIADHNYKPPEEFLQAVLNGPKPDSEEYKRKFITIL